ncbi:MAG: hypothetical protein AB1586_31800 [Pseudomonadota bacterium]
MSNPIGQDARAALSTEARSQNGWLPTAVDHKPVFKACDLAKMEPNYGELQPCSMPILANAGIEETAQDCSVLREHRENNTRTL